MKGFLLVVLGMLALGVAPAALAGGTVQVELNAVNTFPSPCNGELVVFRGPLKVHYQETGSKYVVHFWFDDTGVGSLGNEYLLRREAMGVFDAPTIVRPDGVLLFDVEGHGEVISKGSAPNFELATTTRVAVRDGVPFATQSLALEETCHG